VEILEEKATFATINQVAMLSLRTYGMTVNPYPKEYSSSTSKSKNSKHRIRNPQQDRGPGKGCRAGRKTAGDTARGVGAFLREGQMSCLALCHLGIGHDEKDVGLPWEDPKRYLSAGTRSSYIS